MLPGYRGREAASCNRDQPASTKCEYILDPMPTAYFLRLVSRRYVIQKTRKRNSGNIDLMDFNIKLLLSL